MLMETLYKLITFIGIIPINIEYLSCIHYVLNIYYVYVDVKPSEFIFYKNIDLDMLVINSKVIQL